MKRYAETLILYQYLFGEKPCQDVWETPADRFNPRTQLKKMRLTRIVAYQLKVRREEELMFENTDKRKGIFEMLDKCLEEAKITGKAILPKV